MKFEIGDEVVTCPEGSRAWIVTNAFVNAPFKHEKNVVVKYEDGTCEMRFVRRLSPAPKPEYCAIFRGYTPRVIETGCWAEKKLTHGYEIYGHLVRDRPDATPSEWRWEPVEVQA